MSWRHRPPMGRIPPWRRNRVRCDCGALAEYMNFTVSTDIEQTGERDFQSAGFVLPDGPKCKVCHDVLVEKAFEDDDVWAAGGDPLQHSWPTWLHCEAPLYSVFWNWRERRRVARQFGPDDGETPSLFL